MADAPSRSLRRRLTLWLILSTLVIGVLALLDTGAEARRTAREVSDRVLMGSALAIADGVSVDAEGGVAVSIPFSALAMLTSAAQDQVFYRVDAPEGFLTGYADLDPVPLAAGQEAAFGDAAMRGTAIRTVTLLRELTGVEGLIPVKVTVAESTRARDGLAQRILARSAIRIGLLIAGAAVVAWIAATLALRPVSRLSRLLSDRAPHDLSPVDAPAPSELKPVLTALNGFLSRLQGAISALRSFASNANHQIRTPLTVARTQIAVAQKARSAADRSAALHAADDALVRSERVLAQLLVLAQVKATGAGPAIAPVDVARLCRDIVIEQLPEAIRLGQDLGYDGSEQLTAPSADVLLGEMLRNLTGNALRHCPAGTVVTASVEDRPEGPRIIVADNGPPVSDAVFESLLRRLEGQRADGANLLAMHGLGLLIVREIAQTLGIGLALSRRAGGGGLVFTLDLPR